MLTHSNDFGGSHRKDTTENTHDIKYIFKNTVTI